MFAITGNYIKISRNNNNNSNDKIYIHIIKHFNEIELNFCNDNPFKVEGGSVWGRMVGGCGAAGMTSALAFFGRGRKGEGKLTEGNNCANILGQHFLILVNACSALANTASLSEGKRE